MVFDVPSFQTESAESVLGEFVLIRVVYVQFYDLDLKRRIFGEKQTYSTFKRAHSMERHGGDWYKEDYNTAQD